MEVAFLPAATAAWLGILTSVSPCPLATNIVAISFISRDVGSSARVLWTGLLYTLGRTLTYAALGALLVGSVLSIRQISLALQYWMNRLLGPILIVVGMFLLDLLRLNFSPSLIGNSLQDRAQSWGRTWGAGLLGMIFALSFCPVSAALFFGSLIPLSLKAGSQIALPVFYGIGTGLPVALFAIGLAAGAKGISTALNRLGEIELRARRATGVLFMAVGNAGLTRPPCVGLKRPLLPAGNKRPTRLHCIPAKGLVRIPFSFRGAILTGEGGGFTATKGGDFHRRSQPSASITPATIFSNCSDRIGPGAKGDRHFAPTRQEVGLTNCGRVCVASRKSLAPVLSAYAAIDSLTCFWPRQSRHLLLFGTLRRLRDVMNGSLSYSVGSEIGPRNVSGRSDGISHMDDSAWDPPTLARNQKEERNAKGRACF